MSSLITAVFKATIGLLVNKGRDKLAEKLNEGDVTDQKFRGLIVREIDEIKSKLDGLARTPLKTGISLFKEGIELLYEVFESARPSTEHRAIEAAATACVEQFDIAKEMRKLQLTALDESATRKLSKAMKTFSEARLEAMRAFSNEALELPDRLLAMQYRLMATILRNIDNPTDALAACRVCLDELHQVPAVKEYFKVELEEGLRLRARFNKDERRQIIFSVCHANRVIYDVMSKLGSGKMWTLPYVETGKEKVDPLRNERVIEVLAKQGKEHCCVTPWSFGQEGEEEHKLKKPCGIATNTKGQFLIADMGDTTVKVFDSNGKFDFRFNPQTDDADTKLDILDVATAGEDDNIYILVKLKKPGAMEWENEVQVFSNTADLQHKFPVRRGGWVWNSLTLSSGKQRGKILLLTGNVVDVYELSGEFVSSFEGVFENATDITTTCDGRVMIDDQEDESLYIFDVEGHQLGKFNINYNERNVSGYFHIACHPASEHVVVAGKRRETRHLTLAIYTVNGEFIRRIQLDEELSLEHLGFVRGITVTVEGHIAVAFGRDEHKNEKIDGLALTSMTDRDFDQIGLVAMGDRLALRAFCAPKKDDNFDDKVEHLKEALNGRGKRQGDQCVAVGRAGRNKRSLKPTLKVEFGWKHFCSGKYMQVKKSKGGGTRSVAMNRTAQYDECLLKAQELFFPNQTSQFGKLTDMADCHLANYSGERITNEGFSVTSYKQQTGMNLPRLYFLTKKARHGVQLSTPISNREVLEVPEEVPVNFMQEDDCHENDSSSLIARDESLIQSRVAWCCDQMSKLEEPPLTEPHIMSVVFPTKFIRSTQSRTFKQTAFVKDLYSWIGTFHSVPAHFSIALDKGRILKDFSQQLCQIGNHIGIEVLQIHPDVIRGNEDIISTELICKCAICTDGLLPDEMVARPNQCFHIFHHTCIDEWLKVDEEGGMACPVCGKKFKSIIVCSTTDEPEKKMCVSESVENREGEAQKLVFEDYMDNGQDSGKLKEARAKEWESLSENTITRAFVNRDTIVEDILQLYRVNREFKIRRLRTTNYGWTSVVLCS